LFTIPKYLLIDSFDLAFLFPWLAEVYQELQNWIEIA
jgi:hypothetical protein